MKDKLRKPRFGERIRGIYASESNPQRDGMYVRTIRRTGRMNPGTWYELTDGKGNFWQYESKSAVFLDAEGDGGAQDEDEEQLGRDDVTLRLIDAIEERDHLRSVLATNPARSGVVGDEQEKQA